MSDLKGLDKEIHDRISSKYDPQLEQKALDWIGVVAKRSPPRVVGRDGDALFEWLRSGVILCEMLNGIVPSIIPQRAYTKSPKNMLEERVGRASPFQAGSRESDRASGG